MHNNQLIQTQHYTTNAKEILKNIIEYMPKNIDIIEPFVGKGDLIPYIQNIASSIEMFDIDSKIGIKQDTLLTPPNYKNKWVVTNPPYLAKNKSIDKSIYEKYQLDDLYKIAIKTMIDGDVNGGILIVPINFLIDENTEKLRQEFFKYYNIHYINYFTYQIFDDTSYSICAFYFDKNDVKETIINIFYKNGNHSILTTNIKGRLFQEFYDSINIKPIVSRITESNVNEATFIKIFCIDNKKSLIRAEYCEEPYIGKNSDRTFFTMAQPKNYKLSIELQKKVIDKFNEFIYVKRNQYSNLIFTNYRENNRKRISFDIAYSILTKIIYEVINDI